MNYIHILKTLPRHGSGGEGGEEGGEGLGEGGGGPSLPTVSSTSTSNILGKSIRLSASVTSAGGGTVSSRGFYFGTNSNASSNTQYSSGAGVGSFIRTISGLTSSETYYFAAYAVNEAGTRVAATQNVNNVTTFKASGQITMTELKEAFDSPQASSNVSLDFLAQTTGLNINTNISFSDFYGHTPNLTVFYRGGTCNGTTNTATYHGGAGTVPVSGDYIFTSQFGGRVNFLSNGTYGFNTNGLNSQTVTRQFIVSSGKVTSISVCSGGGGRPSERRLKYNIEFIGDSPLGIPMYHFNYKNKLYGEGRFVGTMVDDLQRLGFEDTLIYTNDGILVNYDMIDVNFKYIGD